MSLTTSTALVRARWLDLDSFARASGLHPEMVRRLVRLGLLDPSTTAVGELRFPPAQLAAAARLQRLRAGLALNYAALGVVVDLLDRVAELEAALRTGSARPQPRPDGARSWRPRD